MEGDKEIEMQKTITIQTYTTPDGKPTCARDMSNKEFCVFLGTMRFGTAYICVMGKETDLRGRPMPLAEYEPMSYLKPCDDCIVHGGRDDL